MKYKILIFALILFSSIIFGFVVFGQGAHPDSEFYLDYCDQQIKRSLKQFKDTDGYIDYTLTPRNILDTTSVWNRTKVSPEEWCAGFWPGILWYDYESTNDEIIKVEAEKYTDALESILQQPVFDHDLGFLMYCSYGNAYRLTGEKKYQNILLAAADSLASLFNPKAGTILSWPRNVKVLGGHNTIMDNMMNLELLFWAAKNGGNPYLYDIAVSHAEKTMAHHFRPDYTSYHVAIYDSISGDFVKGVTHQGFSDSSMWARGQAWAIYGFTMVYRETHDKKFLDFACNVADIYLCNLPDDLIPYWDFNAPDIPNAPRDASAAAITASALLELSTFLPKEQSLKYLDYAEKIIQELCSDKYLSGNDKPSFLLHSTGHYPAGSEINASIIYTDYYYIEALLRLKRLKTGALIIG